jgi:lysozyme
MARRIDRHGLEKIKRWEGLRLSAYRDEAGVLTIGYGHTSAAGAPMVTARMQITEQEAEAILLADLAKFEERVERLVKVALTDNQFAALVSFDFNTGSLHSSTLLKKLNAGNYEAVPAELAKWVKTTDPATKKKITCPGLVNRRAAEIGLWASGSFVASAAVAAKPKADPVITKESLTWAAGAAAPVMAMQGEGPVQWALAAILVAAFAVGLFFLLRKRMMG